jgi:hypothetical protein
MDLSIPILTYFKKKNVCSYTVQYSELTFLNQKGHFRKKWLKIKNNIFCHLILGFFSAIQISLKYIKVLKSQDPTLQLVKNKKNLI